MSVNMVKDCAAFLSHFASRGVAELLAFKTQNDGCKWQPYSAFCSEATPFDKLWTLLQEAPDTVHKTWSGPPLPASLGSTTTWRKSAGSANKARPSVFDAFDIERPATRMGHKTAAKHKPIFDAFGVTDRGSETSLQRMDSTQSTGTCPIPLALNSGSSITETKQAAVLLGKGPGSKMQSMGIGKVIGSCLDLSTFHLSFTVCMYFIMAGCYVVRPQGYIYIHTQH